MNINSDGAKIVLTGAVVLPPRVRLSVPSAGLIRVADVVWQEESEAGLKFLRQR